jgi:peptidoglycan/LPS O-acetylase OafA/YrhL
MLPLGPKSLQLNDTIAATGMSLFFILSGFLIVSMLIKNDNVASFLVRRACRILPLAWSFLALVLIINKASLAAWAANFLFYANLPPFYLDYTNGHFWSLCVEVQFYVAIAIAVGIAGRYGLILVPTVCIAITTARIIFGVHTSIVTWWRVDEILAGGCLALIFASGALDQISARSSRLALLLGAPLLIASASPLSGPLNCGRPYLAALLIGSTLGKRNHAALNFLGSHALAYLAEISYALYVIHPLTYAGWLGEGDVAIRYAKRIGSFLATFLLAHISTRYFEKYWIAIGHRIASRLDAEKATPPYPQ